MQLLDALFEGAQPAEAGFDQQLPLVGSFHFPLPAVDGTHRRQDVDACRQSLFDQGRRELFGVAVCGECRQDEDRLLDHRYNSDNACSRSAIRSSTSSMPTEILIKPSPMPSIARRSGGIEACVMIAGCEIRVSTPPRLSASDISFNRLSTVLALSSEATSKEINPPKPFICLRARL